MNTGIFSPSSWRDNLIDLPKGQYKFGSIHLQVDLQKKITIRQSYAFLDFFGDIGGFIDVLNYLFTFILAPFWKFNFSSKILTRLFRDGSTSNYHSPKTQSYNAKSSQLS